MNFRETLICAALVSSLADARIYNYFDLPVGERSAGMGMTAVAASSDVGDAYLNPAAVADLQAPMIGASVSSYSRLDARTGETVSLFESIKDSLTHGTVDSTPAFVGGNFNTKGWVWGGGVVMPSTLSFYGTLKPLNNEVVSYASESRTTHLLTFVSKRWGTFSYGVSLSMATLSEEERSFKLVSSNPNELVNAEYFYSLNALLAGFGTVWDFAPGWRLGLSTSIPVALLAGDGTFTEVVSGAADHSADSFSIERHPFPLRFSLGLEWMPSPVWTIAGDLHWFAGFERNLAPKAPQSMLSIDAKSVLNLSLGVQWRGWTRVGLRAGLFTNFSSSKEKFSPHATLQDSVDMIGATGAIYFPTPNGSISLGGFFQGGQGRMIDIASDSPGTTTTRRSVYLYGAALGSTYLFL